jgi:hypothetical protein
MNPPRRDDADQQQDRKVGNDDNVRHDHPRLSSATLFPHDRQHIVETVDDEIRSGFRDAHRWLDPQSIARQSAFSQQQTSRHQRDYSAAIIAESLRADVEVTGVRYNQAENR